MFFLLLILSCTFGNFKLGNKVRRWDISKAIREPSLENRAVLEKVNKSAALHKNNQGLIPIEEAVEVENVEAVALLMNIEKCEYPYRVYEKIINTGNIEIFALIPEENLCHKMLLQIIKNSDDELENIFLTKLEFKNFKELILEQKVEDIKKEIKEWIKNEYDSEDEQIAISPIDILCMYGGDLVERLLENTEGKLKNQLKNSLLITASKLGKEEIVLYLLEMYVHSVKNLNGALRLAAENGNKRICQFLLDNGAIVNAVDREGCGALMLAAENDHKEICKLLLERGADIEVTNEEGWTVLMMVSGNGNEKICKLLLDRGANIQATDINGMTALMYAASVGNKNMCKLLLSNGANIEEVNEDGWTPLMHVAVSGHEEICNLLIDKGANIEAADIEGITILMKAAENGNIVICELLLDKGVEIDAGDNFGRRALMFAVANNHTSVCEILLDRLANIDAEDKEGFTALMFAALSGYKDACKLLLHNGAKVNAKNNKALILAVENGHIEVCRMLLDKGADVNAEDDKDKSTALIIASSNDDVELCRLLLDKGANLQRKNKNGKKAIELAIENGHQDVYELLIRYEANTN